MAPETPPLVLFMGQLTGEILDATQRFPKAVRFTFSSRIDGLALDMLLRLVEARYRRPRLELLRAANLALEQLRVLMRLSHDRRYLPSRTFERLASRIDEGGRMLGGWLRHEQEGGAEARSRP